MKERLKILYLCTGNSCRSQMAEGFTRQIKGDQVEAFSAGIEKRTVDPRAVRVMTEAGVDITRQKSKTVDELPEDLEFDYVITLCNNAQKTCPVFPAKTKIIHIPFDDPPQLAIKAKSEEEAISHFRRVRDEIKAFVSQLPDVLEAG